MESLPKKSIRNGPWPLPVHELPEQWTHTKKLAIQVKQNVAPLQANEVSILRRKCQQFEVRGLGRGGARGAASPRQPGDRDGDGSLTVSAWWSRS